MADLVFNIRPAAASDIRNLSSHQANRTPDGFSRINPERSHLNRILLGPATQQEALDRLFDEGVQRPTAQAEAPYCQIVIGAGPEFFRPSKPEAEGAFEDGRVADFEREAMAWLHDTFGHDLVHVALHLDEVTPHLHVLVAPTYDRAARKPGRQKKGETDEAFEARKKEAAERPTIRTVSRSRHALLSQQGSYALLRRSLANRLAPLGIEYGEDRAVDAPAPRTTMEWVKEQAFVAGIHRDGAEDRLADAANRLSEVRSAIQAEEEALEQLRHEREALIADLDRREKVLAAREAALRDREKELEQQQAWIVRGAGNLQAAVQRALAGKHDIEITPADMAKEPEKLEILRRAAPAGRPTFGWRARFWSLHYNSGLPVEEKHLPSKIREAFEKAFDQVAEFAREISGKRQEAEVEVQKILTAAKARADEIASEPGQVRSAKALIGLIRTSLREVLSDDAYERIKAKVNTAWAAHPDNINRPEPDTAPYYSSGPSGP